MNPRHFLFVFSAYCLFPLVLWGQTNDTIRLDLSSPYQTITAHLRYLQPDRFEPQVAALTIHSSIADAAERERLVVQIKQIMDGQGIFIDPDDLGTHTYYLKVIR